MSRIFRRFAACAVAVVAAVFSINLYAAEGSLTFAVSGYSGSAAFTGFPVLVRLAEDTPTGFSYNDCAAGGTDIVFYDSDENEVPYEIDTWNTSGTSLIWVRLPSMTAGTRFRMNYGAGAHHSTTTADTWSDCGAVFHMETGLDSVAGNNGTFVTSTSVDAVDGLFGKCRGSTSADSVGTGPIMKFPVSNDLKACAN